MKVGELVRVSRRLPSWNTRLQEGDVGVIVTKNWNSLGTACRLEVLFEEKLETLHPGWLEVVSEGR